MKQTGLINVPSISNQKFTVDMLMILLYCFQTFLTFPYIFLNYLNSEHPNIKFTCENEAENQLNFLDVSVHRKDYKFETSVYRKPTFTGLGLRYDSFVPKSYKINLISCLIHRAYEISSNWTNFENI